MMKRNCFLQSVFTRKVSLLGAVAIALAFAGCGGSHDHEHAEGEHDHDHEGHAHEHHAPHGGALGMLGDHAFQIEILPDQEAGEIDLYVLDGEAENFVRVATPSLQAVGKAGEQEWTLSFLALANEATGETVGSSSHFAASAAELVGAPEFELYFERLELLGQVYENVTIPYPEGAH